MQKTCLPLYLLVPVFSALLVSGCASVTPTGQAASTSATGRPAASAGASNAAASATTAAQTLPVSTSAAEQSAPVASAAGTLAQSVPIRVAEEAKAEPISETLRYDNLLDRIRTGFAMPQLDSPLVAQHERWIQRNPEYLNRVFERGGKYLHHIVEELEARNMPTELALLPIVESAFNPQALSKAKAAGLWQFIPSTGRAFDLKQDWWLDQRRDVIDSTRAALDYLQKIYEMQGNDWFLGLASYNWGEGAVKRARKRNQSQGKPDDYLSLKMPRETQNYVPRLIALRNVLADPAAFGLRLPVIENKPFFVVIDKEQSIDLKLAARFAELSVAEFTELNPAHHRPVISASRTNRIVLPADRAEIFQDKLQQHISSGQPLVSWKPYTLKANDTLALIAKRSGVTAQDLIRANSLRRNAQPMPGTIILAPIAAQMDEPHIETTLARFRGTKVIERERSNAVYHRVKRKDTLASVAKRYGVSQASLRSLNKLKDDVLTTGMRLLIRPAQTRTVMTDERGVKRVMN